MYRLNKKRGFKYDYLIVFQPTQPLRQIYHIDEAIDMLINSYKDSLVSVSKVYDHPLLIRKIDEKHILYRVIN